jgi:hypothetical protein
MKFQKKCRKTPFTHELASIGYRVVRLQVEIRCCTDSPEVLVLVYIASSIAIIIEFLAPDL